MFVHDAGPLDSPQPPIVFLHDLLFSHYSFRRVLPTFARTRRTIAIDLPGCGDSDRPRPTIAHKYGLDWVASAVWQTVRILAGRDQPVDVIGHGLGGLVALRMVGARPAHVRKVVLCGTPSRSMPLPALAQLGLVPGVGPALLRRFLRRADLRRILARAFSSQELLDPLALDLYWDRLCRAGGVEAAVCFLRQLGDLDLRRAELREIASPTALVWGDGDRVTPQRHGQDLAAMLPGASFRLIEGCGHCPATERPTAFLVAAQDHLA